MDVQRLCGFGEACTPVNPLVIVHTLIKDSHDIAISAVAGTVHFSTLLIHRNRPALLVQNLDGKGRCNRDAPSHGPALCVKHRGFQASSIRSGEARRHEINGLVHTQLAHRSPLSRSPHLTNGV